MDSTMNNTIVNPGLEGGAQYFQNDMNLKVFVDGEINGMTFKVTGEGTARSPHGEKFMHAVCETGKLPMSWKAISHTFLYGFPQFINYPSGLTHFAQECYPEGIMLDRTVDFDNEGTMQSHHEFELEGNTITARVKLTGSGFDPNGSVMKDGLVDIMTTQSHLYPWGENSVRQINVVGYHRKDGSILLSKQDNMITFLGTRKVKLPNPHFATYSTKQMKDDSDERDHIITREMVVAHPVPQMMSAIGTPTSIMASH